MNSVVITRKKTGKVVAQVRLPSRRDELHAERGRVARGCVAGRPR